MMSQAQVYKFYMKCRLESPHLLHKRAINMFCSYKMAISFLLALIQDSNKALLQQEFGIHPGMVFVWISDKDCTMHGIKKNYATWIKRLQASN